MKILNYALGGLTGAIALNIIHETSRHFIHKAPRVDLVGKEAITKASKALRVDPPSGNNLYLATLAGDIISNAFYFSLIGIGKRKNLINRGIEYGAVAGIGALTLTEHMGLNDAPVTRSTETKILTVAYYTIGGIISALTIKALS